MKLSVEFNGHDLSEFIVVLDGFTQFVGSDWKPSLSETDGTPRGAEFEYTTYKSKTIPMPFYIKTQLPEKYDELQKILNVDEPKALIFGNS